jgi:thiol-disulfide isomerase/thioredoxin
MPYLVAAVVAVGLLGLVNLMLLTAVLRRLRTQASDHHPSPFEQPMARVGTRVDDFAVSTVDGTAWSRESLTGDTLVGFFSPGCPACEDLLPEFVAYAERFPGGADQVVAVVEALPEDAGRYVSRLSPVARVVTDPPSRAVVAPAFAVRAFPGVVMVDATGLITAGGSDIGALPVPAPAR